MLQENKALFAYENLAPRMGKLLGSFLSSHCCLWCMPAPLFSFWGPIFSTSPTIFQDLLVLCPRLCDIIPATYRFWPSISWPHFQILGQESAWPTLVLFLSPYVQSVVAWRAMTWLLCTYHLGSRYSHLENQKWLQAGKASQSVMTYQSLPGCPSFSQ